MFLGLRLSSRLLPGLSSGFESNHNEMENLLVANIKQALGFHSLRALSTLRRSGLRTASAAAKPYQGDSSKFYPIIGSSDGAADGLKDMSITTHAHNYILIKHRDN
ncbi:hypothetical protein Tco_0767416 [Tanacetum coccineum]